jgi:hypothetical protein
MATATNLDELTPSERARKILDWFVQQAHLRGGKVHPEEAHEYLTKELAWATMKLTPATRERRAGSEVQITTKTKARALVDQWLSDLVSVGEGYKNGPPMKYVIETLQRSGALSNLIQDVNSLLIEQFDIFHLYVSCLIKCGPVLDENGACAYCDTIRESNGGKCGFGCPWGELETLLTKGKVD